VLNDRGEVIGVSVLFLQEGQNLNFAVPVADVRALAGSAPGRIAFPAETEQKETQNASQPPNPKAVMTAAVAHFALESQGCDRVGAVVECSFTVLNTASTTASNQTIFLYEAALVYGETPYVEQRAHEVAFSNGAFPLSGWRSAKVPLQPGQASGFVLRFAGIPAGAYRIAVVIEASAGAMGTNVFPTFGPMTLAP
jgi:hypothetical protein